MVREAVTEAGRAEVESRPVPRGRRWGSGGASTLLLLLPALVAFASLFCYPMALTVVLSLRPEGAEAGWTLANYTGFLRDPDSRWTMLLTLGLRSAPPPPRCA